MNSHEELFSKDFSDVPPMPAGMFTAIETRIRRRQMTLRAGWGAALGLVLVVTGLTFNTLRPTQTPVATNGAVSRQTVNEDALKELQRVRDYLNGSNIAEEVAMYAIAYEE